MILRIALAGTLTMLMAAAPRAQTKPHTHGALKIDIAIEGSKLSIDVEMPLDNLVGFERAPRTDAERKSAAAALARMRAGADLFKPNPEAQCTARDTKVEAALLEPGATGAPASGHADLDATYVFECAEPAQLTTLDIAIFDAFKRANRIDVQVAGPKGQSKVVLRAPARRVQLVK